MIAKVKTMLRLGILSAAREQYETMAATKDIGDLERDFLKRIAQECTTWIEELKSE
jgi:hypothetical protein